MDNFEFIADTLTVKYGEYFAKCETKEIYNTLIETDYEIIINLPEIKFKNKITNTEICLQFTKNKTEIEILRESIQLLQNEILKLSEKITKFEKTEDSQFDTENYKYVLIEKDKEIKIEDEFLVKYSYPNYKWATKYNRYEYGNQPLVLYITNKTITKIIKITYAIGVAKDVNNYYYIESPSLYGIHSEDVITDMTIYLNMLQHEFITINEKIYFKYPIAKFY